MTYRALKGLFFLLPLSTVLSGCVVSCRDGNDVRCNNEVCCDDYGCWPIDDGDGHNNDGGGNTTNGQGANGGAGGAGAQGGAGGGTGGDGGAGGSAPTCDPLVTVCPCSTNEECGDLSCIDGQCLDPCTFDYECGSGRVCVDGRCATTCGADPCDAGYMCIGGACVVDPANPACTDGTCDGTTCINGFCTTTCTTNEECPDGQLCDSASGGCFDDPTPQPVCDDNNPCPGVNQTCGDDGFCHYQCDTVQDCLLIDSRFDACDNNICKTDTELNPDCTWEIPCTDPDLCISNECVTP